jgi:SAM-dependent methyltransferase
MNWIVKASLKKALSALPGGKTLDYLFQTRVTKSLPHSDEQFFSQVGIASQHFKFFLEYGQPAHLSNVAFYEFGAGWDLLVPLAYYAFGIDCQTLIDIRPNLHFELIDDSIRRFSDYHEDLEQRFARPRRAIKPLREKTKHELKERFGITYMAPLDAANTRLPSASFDFITSTATLEHIPQADIAKILVECHRLLKPEGVICCTVDMRDHFCDFDSKIGPYNFLKFSDSAWKWLNSPLHFLNRLRYPDYINLVKMSGLAIAAQKTNSPTPAELKTLSSMGLADSFRMGYSLEELGIKGLYLVLQKREKPEQSRIPNSSRSNLSLN